MSISLFIVKGVQNHKAVVMWKGHVPQETVLFWGECSLVF